MRRKQTPLREGFTTGSAAAAAAKAAVLSALCAPFSREIEIPLPSPHGFTGRLVIPISSCGRSAPLHAAAEVVKDAGDDPDATHGASIRCSVALHAVAPEEDSASVSVRVEGGEGIGRVTLPGLPVPPGFAAINPVPRRQIALAVAEGLAEAGSAAPPGIRSVDVLVEMPAGAALARKTMNARLGILGGLSVLGTSGIVKPFSHASWRATVESGLDVARAAGLDTVCLCTGRRSEALAQRLLPELPSQGFVQMADLFSHALKHAAQRGFSRVVISCYGGKLAKMAQGLGNTHADSGRLDFAALAEQCRSLGMSEEGAFSVCQAVTARRVFDLARGEGLEQELASLLAKQALLHARSHAGTVPKMGLLAFDAKDSLLARAELEASRGEGHA